MILGHGSDLSLSLSGKRNVMREIECKGAHPASLSFNGLAWPIRWAGPRRTQNYNIFQLLSSALAPVLYLDVQMDRHKLLGNSLIGSSWRKPSKPEQRYRLPDGHRSPRNSDCRNCRLKVLRRRPGSSAKAGIRAKSAVVDRVHQRHLRSHRRGLIPTPSNPDDRRGLRRSPQRA
jgi:hypothetical protein